MHRKPNLIGTSCYSSDSPLRQCLLWVHLGFGADGGGIEPFQFHRSCFHMVCSKDVTVLPHCLCQAISYRGNVLRAPLVADQHRNEAPNLPQ